MSFFGKITSRYLNLSVLLGFSSKIFRRELGEEQSSFHKICKLSRKAWLYTSSTSFSLASTSGRWRGSDTWYVICLLHSHTFMQIKLLFLLVNWIPLFEMLLWYNLLNSWSWWCSFVNCNISFNLVKKSRHFWSYFQCVVGTTKIKNLNANIQSVAVKLTPEDVKEITDAIPVSEVCGARESGVMSKYEYRLADTRWWEIVWAVFDMEDLCFFSCLVRSK